jgi:hypothetical protein
MDIKELPQLPRRVIGSQTVFADRKNEMEIGEFNQIPDVGNITKFDLQSNIKVPL